MKNLTVSIDDDLHRRLRVRAAETGQSMSRYLATLVERDVEANSAVDDETLRLRKEALRRLFDAPKIAISENGRMPNADERNARR